VEESLGGNASGWLKACGIFGFWAAIARRKENDLAPEYEEISHFLRWERQHKIPRLLTQINGKSLQRKEKDRGQGFLLLFGAKK